MAAVAMADTGRGKGVGHRHRTNQQGSSTRFQENSFYIPPKKSPAERVVLLSLAHRAFPAIQNRSCQNPFPLWGGPACRNTLARDFTCKPRACRGNHPAEPPSQTP